VLYKSFGYDRGGSTLLVDTNILQAILPDTFADGYPDNPKARDTPVTLWGITIDPHSPIDARVSVVLMKFLRARYFAF